jgi:hypothetical protein
MQAQMNLTSYYFLVRADEKYYESFVNYTETLSGMLDLTVAAQQLDPDTQTMYFSIMGKPYGGITYSANNNLLGLTLPTSTAGASADATSPVQTCRVSFTPGWACADLKLNFGSQMLSYSTGDAVDRKVLAVDVSSAAPLDNYPFDSYTATGFVKVS